MTGIRRYRASDWEAFVALDVETGLQTLRSAPGADRAEFERRWPETLRGRYGWGDHGPTVDQAVVYVVEDADGVYAGHLWLSEEKDPLTGVSRLRVVTVAIGQGYRSRGWGRLLMERAEEEARARNLGSISLSVDAVNVVARKLYEEMGYQTVELQMIHPLGPRGTREPSEG